MPGATHYPIFMESKELESVNVAGVTVTGLADATTYHLGVQAAGPGFLASAHATVNCRTAKS